MSRILILMLVAAGCYSDEQVGVSYGYGYAAPSMEYVGPGVQVIADYDYPVFYSDNYYWRYDGGLWYRSGVYNGGWVASYDVPVGIRGINRPGDYVHYRVNAGWNRGGAYRGGYNGGGPSVRDHRSAPVYNGGYRSSTPSYRPAPSRATPSRAVVRDHRR